MDQSKSNSVIVRICDEQGDDWNDFVSASETASFYHRFEWKTINESEFGHRTHYLTATRDGKVVGVFPLVQIRSRVFGHILCSLPFVNYCGPSCTDNEAERALMDLAYRIADSEQVDYLEVRGTRKHDEALQTSTNKISMTVPLADEPDTLWNAFQPKHRKAIRRVYKSGLNVRSGHEELLDTFYEILSRSWRSLGTPIYRKSYFRKILQTFGDSTRIYVASQGDKPVATAFIGRHRDTVEGMWAGSIPEHRNLHANYVLYWEMLKGACEDGFAYFHLGRSSASSGGEFFKKKWCADTRQLYWQFYLPTGGAIPQLNVDNPKYALAIKTWQRLPLWITRNVGPVLARNIP